ncbi:hypothetical protein RRG08_066303 [Elysia crispata]|uniref:Uncharacterized protein n=1 Tax=Elysia crispata TaxID=231223 RepID=A0AAE1E1K3_9GAST|nr:hypothetical protein RRG08_066303 [Elysia crispata]
MLISHNGAPTDRFCLVISKWFWDTQLLSHAHLSQWSPNRKILSSYLKVVLGHTAPVSCSSLTMEPQQKDSV